MNTGTADIKDPIYLTGGIADQMGAIVLAYGVTMALVARERYGVGQEVNASRYGKDFCTALGLQELIEDPRFSKMKERGKNRHELIQILDNVLATKPRDEWMQILKDGGDFIYAVVNSVNDLPTDPQVLANGYIVDYDHPELGKKQLVGVPVILSETPGNPRGRAPEVGENTELILTDLLGYTWEEVAKLREKGVI